MSDEGNARFTLKMHEEWKGYTTALYEGDVIRGIYNNITGAALRRRPTTVNNATYYTSWMRVIDVRPGKNEVDVVVYPDADTPAGRNFDPSAHDEGGEMGQRRKHGGAEETPAACAHILHRGEGQGLLPRHEADYRRRERGHRSWRIPGVPSWPKPCNQGGDTGIYAKVGVFETIIQRDHLGRPEASDCLSRAVRPRRGLLRRHGLCRVEPQVRAELRALLRLPVALHQGGAKEPPSWDSTDWKPLSGGPRLQARMVERRGLRLRGQPEITLEVLAEIYHRDVTSDPKIKWDWAARAGTTGRRTLHPRALERLPRERRQLAPPCERGHELLVREAPRQAHLHSDRHAHRQERRAS